MAALARQVGFPVGKWLVSGLELEALEEAQWENLATQATIFGCITPQQFEFIMAVPGLRNSFELTPLRSADYLVIGSIGVGWALTIRLLWRRRWFERMLQLGED